MPKPDDKKRKSGDGQAAKGNSAKRQKKGSDDDEIGFLVANTCGLNAGKFGKLETMADDHDLNVILVQEGVPSSSLDFVPTKKWHKIVTSETPDPTQMTFDGMKAVPAVGMSRFYNAFVRKGSGIAVDELTFEPLKSKRLMEHIRGGPEISTTTSRGRVVVKPKDPAKVNLLGLRKPQVLKFCKPGRQPLVAYNYHAPQGSGSAKGYSGMDAPRGHEVMGRVIEDRGDPNTILAGDQNAHLQSMRTHYPGKTIISADGPDRLSHSAISKGLNAEPIDLEGAGVAFNNKGASDCSDHSAYAFAVYLPQDK
jgi:hypothetical protein